MAEIPPKNQANLFKQTEPLLSTPLCGIVPQPCHSGQRLFMILNTTKPSHFSLTVLPVHPLSVREGVALLSRLLKIHKLYLSFPKHCM